MLKDGYMLSKFLNWSQEQKELRSGTLAVAIISTKVLLS